MRPTVRLAVLALALAAGAPPALAQDLDGRAIMEKVDKANRAKDEKDKVSMVIVSPRGERRTRDLTIWFKSGEGDDDRSLVRFDALEPARARLARGALLLAALPPPFAAHRVHTEIPRHLVEPGAEDGALRLGIAARGRGDLGRSLGEAQEHFLDHVLAAAPRPEQGLRVAQERLLVAKHERLEGVRVAGAPGREQTSGGAIVHGSWLGQERNAGLVRLVGPLSKKPLLGTPGSSLALLPSLLAAARPRKPAPRFR